MTFLKRRDNRSDPRALDSIGRSSCREIEVRYLFIAAVAAFFAGAVPASEPVAVSLPVAEAVAPILLHDLAPATAARGALGNAPELKPAFKPKVARKPKLKGSMLSRTARHQMTLLAVKPQRKSALALDFLHDEDAESGVDNLDLHRSFSRPKVVETADQNDDGEEISDHAKFRLLLARVRALEAHQAAMLPDDDGEALSEKVKLRLFLARMRALQAHQNKFS